MTSQTFVGAGGLICLGLALGAGFFSAACQKQIEPEQTINVEYQITPQPPRVGPAIVSLKLSDAEGKPVRGAHVKLEGNMSHPGMSPVFGEASEAEPGRYQGPLEFTMGGDWFVLLHLTLNDGSKLERQLDVKAVRAG